MQSVIEYLTPESNMQIISVQKLRFLKLSLHCLPCVYIGVSV